MRVGQRKTIFVVVFNKNFFFQLNRYPNFANPHLSNNFKIPQKTAWGGGGIKFGF